MDFINKMADQAKDTAEVRLACCVFIHFIHNMSFSYCCTLVQEGSPVPFICSSLNIYIYCMENIISCGHPRCLLHLLPWFQIFPLMITHSSC